MASSSEIIVSSMLGVVIRLRCSEIRQCGRLTTGFKMVTMDKGDTVVDIALTEEETHPVAPVKA